MKHTYILVLTTLFILPTIATAQEAMLDSSFDDSMDFDSLFEQIDESIREENVATSGFKEDEQGSTPEPTNIPTRESKETDVYSTDSTEIILYRQNKEVKRLPLNTPIDQMQTEPDSGKLLEDEEPELELDDLDSFIDDDLSTGGMIQTTDFGDIDTGTGKKAETQTGSMNDGLKNSASGGGSIISSGTLTMGVSIIAIVVGGFFGLTILKKRKLDAGILDMPSGVSDSRKMNKLEAALDEIKS